MIPATVTTLDTGSLGYFNTTDRVGGFTIYGASGSEAATYANDNGFTFVGYNYSGATGDCSWSQSGTVLEIYGSGVMEDYYSNQAPWYDTGYAEVIIGNGVTNIGYRAFRNCKKLISAVISDSVTSIGETAFCDDTNLTELSLGSGVKTIGNSAFYRCNLSELTIPDSVERIDSSAFESNVNMTKVSIGTGVESISSDAFKDCGLKEAIIPCEVTYISEFAFENNPELTIFGFEDSYAEAYAR